MEKSCCVCDSHEYCNECKLCMLCNIEFVSLKLETCPFFNFCTCCFNNVDLNLKIKKSRKMFQLLINKSGKEKIVCILNPFILKYKAIVESILLLNSQLIAENDNLNYGKYDYNYLETTDLIAMIGQIENKIPKKKKNINIKTIDLKQYILTHHFIPGTYSELYNDLYKFTDHHYSSKYSYISAIKVLRYKYSIEVTYLLDTFNIELKDFLLQYEKIYKCVYMQCKYCSTLTNDYSCNQCNITYCSTCLETSCTLSDCNAKSICPTCYEVYELLDGCDHVFCSKCKTAFSFKNRTQVQEYDFFHNNDYFKYISKNQTPKINVFKKKIDINEILKNYFSL